MLRTVRSWLHGAWAVAVVAGVLYAPGTAHADGAVPKWALVGSTGSLVRGAGATDAARLGTGTYEVVFKSDVSNCAYVATVGDPGAGVVSQPAVATVASLSGNAEAIGVQTWDQSTGALADLPFHVVTYCGTALGYAVVGSSGGLARGAHVTSTTHLGRGAFEVIFDKQVNRCAFNATVGSIGARPVGTPAEITVATRAGNNHGVFVAIVDRTGATHDASFHLGVTCGSSNLIGVINSDGTKARGPNVVSATKLTGTNGGTYEVIFDTTVSSCGYAATIGEPAAGSVTQPVTITTATRAGNPNGVFVFIHLANGLTVDEPFHLFVFCPGTTTAPPSSTSPPGDNPQDGAATRPAPPTTEPPGVNG